MLWIHFYCFVLVLHTQFHGIVGQSHKFFRAGHNATLPCEKASTYTSYTCSGVNWLFSRDPRSTVYRVRQGQVQVEHPGVTVNSDCSLTIHKVSAEDVGLYTCSLWENRPDAESRVYLGVLTVSAVLHSSSSNPEGRVTLQCTVSRYDISCSQNRIQWLDENRDTVSQNSENNCVSSLTVDRHDNRRFTCQYLNAKGKQFISAVYTQEGISPETVYLYSGPGPTTLPCTRLNRQGSQCSDVDWLLYTSSGTYSVDKVREGNIVDSESSRLTLNSDCSLSLQNVTGKDSGRYICRIHQRTGADTSVYLSVLTVSRAPDSSSNQNGSITIQCQLWKYDPYCKDNFRWWDQDQMVLPGQRTNCISYLTVERQSQHDRVFTCQYMRNNEEKVSAEYRLTGTKEIDSSNASDGHDGNNNIIIIVGAVVSLLVLLVIAAVVLFKIKSKSNSPENTQDTQEDQPTQQPVYPVTDPEDGMTYAMIDHKTRKPKQQVVVEDDSVTYSAVAIKTAADYSNSAIYSTVNKSR